MPNDIPIQNRGIDPVDFDSEFFGDLNGRQRENQPYIFDLVTKEKLFLQGLPQEVVESPDNEFVAIRTPGRNNPRYHFTGGEDTIQMTVTFFSDHESRQDVIKKVKWLQALGKNDGYDNPPHEVLLCFGDLFKGSKFIVPSVLPRYSNFNRPYKMLPVQAEVDITFKRVTDDNRTRSNMLKYDT